MPYLIIFERNYLESNKRKTKRRKEEAKEGRGWLP